MPRRLQLNQAWWGLRKNVVQLPTPTWHHVLVLASTSGARRLSAYRLLACLLTATGSIEEKERALRSGRS